MKSLTLCPLVAWKILSVGFFERAMNLLKASGMFRTVILNFILKVWLEMCSWSSPSAKRAASCGAGMLCNFLFWWKVHCGNPAQLTLDGQNFCSVFLMETQHPIVHGNPQFFRIQCSCFCHWVGKENFVFSCWRDHRDGRTANTDKIKQL